MYVYALCEFEYGYTGEFYQRNDESGATEFFALDGTPLALESPYGYFVVETNVTPPWA